MCVSQFVQPCSGFVEVYPKVGLADLSVYYIVCEGFGQRHRITVYNYTWDLKWTIGRHGTNDGELNYPFTAIVSDEGNIFILDLHNERVSEFHFNGTFPYNLVGSDGDEEPYSMSYYYPHLWLVHGFPPKKNKQIQSVQVCLLFI